MPHPVEWLLGLSASNLGTSLTNPLKDKTISWCLHNALLIAGGVVRAPGAINESLNHFQSSARAQVQSLAC